MEKKVLFLLTVLVVSMIVSTRAEKLLKESKSFLARRHSDEEKLLKESKSFLARRHSGKRCTHYCPCPGPYPAACCCRKRSVDQPLSPYCKACACPSGHGLCCC